MIGIISKDLQKQTVKEFFQLFKVPWEFYSREKTYDVIFISDNIETIPHAKLIVIFGDEKTLFDVQHNLNISKRTNGILLEHSQFSFPVYQGLAIFRSSNIPFIKIKNETEAAGIEYIGADQRILRVGYDLFDEIAFLLSQGQPVEFAQIPTVEIHIALLREWIINTGLMLVEIPPVPSGYKFSVCLTHDVDFIKISQHKFDHTIMGFIYRALFSSLRGFLTGRFPLRKLLKNYKAVLSLPFIYLGLIEDFWFEFDKYIEIEQGVKSTYFIIPFKNRAGEKVSSENPHRRATRYDIDDIRDVVQKLIHSGFEIGLHGIDAWHSQELAFQELKRITDITGQSEMGIRMHWLCFDEGSPKILDQAGFIYDATIGYNETIGYRSGTTQVFQPSGMKNLLELPQHIQDIALLSPNHRGLTEKQAWEKCKNMFHDAAEHGGVLTLLWHIRSLSPERLWEDFYIRLVSELKDRNAWFATATQAVKWFRIRRTLIFESASFQGNKLYLNLKADASDINPQFLIRVHLPEQLIASSGGSSKRYIDVPWLGSKEVEILLN